MSFFASYYRTDDAAVIAARALDMAGNEYVGSQGNAFAAQFGALAYYSQGLAPHFVGIGFGKDKPLRTPALWAPAIPGVPLRMPARRVPNKLRAQHVTLISIWNNTLPMSAMKPRESELLKALGKKAEDYSNGHQLHLFKENDVLYIISTLPLNLPEVSGSDIRAAQGRIEAKAAQVPALVKELADKTVEAANDLHAGEVKQ